MVEVAALLQCSDQTVRRLVKKGELKMIKVGKFNRFSDEELNRYINRTSQYQKQHPKLDDSQTWKELVCIKSDEDIDVG